MTRRVAYVCADLGIPVFGRKGASVHVQEVLRGLLRRGAQVVLFAQRLGGEVPPDLAALKVVELPQVDKSGDAQARAGAALAANSALTAALQAHGPFDLVYERYSLWSHAGMAYARMHACPGVLEVNAPLIEEQRTHRGLVLPEQAERVARAVFADADALVAVSPGVATYLRGYQQAAGKVHVVANGVACARFAQTSADAGVMPGNHAPLIGFVGTLKPWHGLDVLVDAFARVREHHGIAAHLLVVGDGPGRDSLAQACMQRGLEPHVHLTGAVDPARVPALLAAMDIAVAPYPALDDFYFSPLKIYEYMAAGLPVVASRIGHLDQVLAHGRDGWLVAPGDAAALADALATLLADAPLRRALGTAARARALAEHDWDAVVGRLLAIADQVPAATHLQARGTVRVCA